jgi:ankyrin repeat protein
MKTSFRALILGITLASASASLFAGVYDDLIAAANRDDTETVMSLINRGMDVNSVDPAGNTLLHIATRNGNDKLIAALLKQKANPNARNRVGDSPLMLAAYNGKMGAVDALLAGGAQLNHDGWTPLHYAVFAEQPEMVARLLSKGAQVDARAPNKQTALMLAAKNGNLQIAKLLLNAKADASLKDQFGESAITLAQKDNNTDFARLIEQPSMPVKAAPAPAKSTVKPVPAAPAAKPVDDDLRGEYVPPLFQTEKTDK